MIELDHPNFMEYHNTAGDLHPEIHFFHLNPDRDERDRVGSVFTERAMVRGKADRKDDFPGNPRRVLSILSDTKKLLVEVSANWFHFLHDQMPSIIFQLENTPGIELVIKTARPPMVEELDPASIALIKMASDLGISYQIIDHHEYGLLEINNFIVSRYEPTTFLLNNFYNFCKRYVSDLNVKPFRKIFISRRFIPYEESSVKFENAIEDSRINDHEGLENLFRDAGFDILYPENMKSLEERINLFYETDILVSLTGSGITNALFMQDGATLLEIATPLARSEKISDKWKVLQEFHQSYIHIAFRRNLVYLSIPNISKSLEDLKDLLEDSPIIKRLLGPRR